MKHFVLFFLLISASIEAQEVKDYAQDTNAVAHIKVLSAAENFDENYLYSLLKAIEPDQKILHKIATPAEKKLAWFEYKKIFLDQARIENGANFYRKNSHWLKKAYREYGVDPNIITAIIGVETRYGKVVGNTPTLQSLATLCFSYPPRAAFFCDEFDYFLRLSKREDWNPLQIQGSYAGALGMAQFMPSSYFKDAIDFDGDGKVDLWHSDADAIGSIANYLKNRGWVKDGNLIQKIEQPIDITDFGLTHKSTLSVETLKKQETIISNKNVMNWLDKKNTPLVGSLILQGESQKQYYLTDNNFYVITRYNTSPLYAMAVVKLAELIHNELTESENHL